MDTIVKIAGIAVVSMAAVLGLSILFAFPVKWLWNYLAPVFGQPVLDIWHAWALNVLCGLLFKNGVNVGSPPTPG